MASGPSSSVVAGRIRTRIPRPGYPLAIEVLPTVRSMLQINGGGGGGGVGMEHDDIVMCYDLAGCDNVVLREAI